jgi:long-chain acyl-CoA synthetase
VDYKFLNTINRRFINAAGEYPNRPALSSKPSGAKSWVTLTYREVEERVRYFASGLRTLGVKRGDRVAMLSENRPEWAIADLASQAIGAITVSVYPTLPPSQVAHILSDSGSRAIIVSDANQLKKALKNPDVSPDLDIFITMDDSSAKGDILSFEQVLNAGRIAETSSPEEFRKVSFEVEPHDIISLIYTSGATNSPKGVMITHANMTTAVDIGLAGFPIHPPDDVFLSFLPLCHVFERVAYCISLTTGSHTYYNDSIFKLMDNILDARPTIMQCVPRVYESMHERMLEAIGSAPVEDLDPAQKAALKARFGGRLECFISGGAPLNPATNEFFNAIGLPIIEGWGLTETTAAATVNPVERIKTGTVGPACLGVELKTAVDGEILVRGGNVMKGYWNNPDATAEALEPDGWLHTGDIGEIDPDGYLKITDRKKDIIVLPNGKKVAPQPIEKRIRTNPYITDVVLISDSAGSVGALVVPDYAQLAQWAKDRGIHAESGALARHPDARKFIKKQIDVSAGELADFEKIRKVALLERPLSVDAGELTPTLKLKRRIIAENYAALLSL